MKNLIYLLIVSLVSTMFFSCNKEDDLVVEPAVVTAQSVDDIAVRTKVANLTILTVKESEALMIAQNSMLANSLPTEKVAEILSQLNFLKSALSKPDVYVLPIDSKEYIITDEYVTKLSLYLEIDQNWNRVHEYTLYQTYYFVNGTLDTSSFSFDFDFGCPQDKQLYFGKQGVISDLQYSFVEKGGRTFFFNNNEYYGTIYLPPLANGNWYVQGKVRVNDYTQDFTTKAIDLYSGSNTLPVFGQMNEEGQNVKYFIQLSKPMLKNITKVYLISYDSDGNYIWKQILISYNEEWPDKMSFGNQFDIKAIQLYGPEGYYYYETQGLGYVTEGTNQNDPDWRRTYILD